MTSAPKAAAPPTDLTFRAALAIGLFCALWAVPAWFVASWLGARGDVLLYVTAQTPALVALLLWALGLALVARR